MESSMLSQFKKGQAMRIVLVAKFLIIAVLCAAELVGGIKLLYRADLEGIKGTSYSSNQSSNQQDDVDPVKQFNQFGPPSQSATARAQRIINNAFKSIDKKILGTPQTYIFGKPDVKAIIDDMSKSLDVIGKSMGALPESMQPIKKAFSDAIIFFGTRSPENMGIWLPKIIDVAKFVITAPVKLAIQLAGTGVGTAVGGVHGVAKGVKKSVYDYNPAFKIPGISKEIRSPQGSIYESLLNVVELIPSAIVVAVGGVVAAPVIIAFETSVGLYRGARVGHDIVKEKVTGTYALRSADTLNSTSNEIVIKGSPSVPEQQSTIKIKSSNSPLMLHDDESGFKDAIPMGDKDFSTHFPGLQKQRTSDPAQQTAQVKKNFSNQNGKEAIVARSLGQHDTKSVVHNLYESSIHQDII